MSLTVKTLLAILLIVLLVLSQSAFAVPTTEVKGTVLAVFPDQQSLIVSADSGGNLTFVLDKQGKVFLDERPGKLADLQPGDYVTVIHDLQGERLLAMEIHCRRDSRVITGRLR